MNRSSTTHQEMFFHFRQKTLTVADKIAQLEEMLKPEECTPEKMTDHLRDFYFCGGTVFARREWQPQEEDWVIPPRRWYAAVSVCSKADQFCRATGRQVARRRYFLWPDHRIDLGETQPTWDQAHHIYIEATRMLLE